MSEANLQLLGVVLCGGRSARMGQDKASLPHDRGGTFLQVAVGRLRMICDEVSVSASTAQPNECWPNVELIQDPVSFQGPMIGVAACLAQAHNKGFAGCLVTPVDMPDLTSDDLRRLRQAWERSPNQIVCAVDEGSGRLEPLVAIYPTCLAQSLEEAASSDDRSLFRWIQTQSAILVPLPQASNRNVNCPEDLST